MINPSDFNDMMPHTISVVSSGVAHTRAGDYGGSATSGAARSYRCLIDQGEAVLVSATGTEFQQGLTAYCNPIPVGGTTPVDILEEDVITILGKTQPIDSIDRHFDTDGTLYALVVTFQ